MLETKSRFNSLLFAEVDLDGLPVELLCVGTEKGTVEVYDVDIVELEDEEDEEKEKEDKEEKEAASDEEDGEAEASAKPTQTAEVERIGTLIGHANRYVQVTILKKHVPLSLRYLGSSPSRHCHTPSLPTHLWPPRS